MNSVDQPSRRHTTLDDLEFCHVVSNRRVTLFHCYTRVTCLPSPQMLHVDLNAEDGRNGAINILNAAREARHHPPALLYRHPFLQLLCQLDRRLHACIACSACGPWTWATPAWRWEKVAARLLVHLGVEQYAPCLDACAARGLSHDAYSTCCT
jgi:hypothetical protein